MADSTSAGASSSRPPVRPPVVQPSSGNAIIINPCQRLNPILECIRNVSKEFGDIVPDFQLGRTTCALYLSLKYHRLHPEYIHQRIQKLGSMYSLRILLLMCDVSEHQDPIRELTKVCLINNITIVVCWSPDEAGLYLSTYKAFEHRSPDIIKERVDKDYNSMLKAALTSISKVNKMDVETLRASFGSFAGIAKATPEQLRMLPGFGPVKVRRMVDAFEKPFRGDSVTEEASSTQLGFRSLVDSTQSQSSERAAPAASRRGDASQSRIDRPSGALAPSAPAAARPSAPREESPPWDIEIGADLDDIYVDDDTSHPASKPQSVANGDASEQRQSTELASRSRRDAQSSSEKTQRERAPSPVWDIELDLNLE